MGRMCAIVGQKGGVCKTTVAVNLAAALVEKGRRVLVLDLDSNATASDWAGVRPEDEGQDFLTRLVNGGDLTPLIKPTKMGFDCIPTGTMFSGFQKICIKHELEATVLLRESFVQLPVDYDYIFLDTPPQLNEVTVAALAVVDFALVPADVAPVVAGPIRVLFDTIVEVKQTMNPKLSVPGVLPVKLKAGQVCSREMLELLRETYEHLLFSATLRETVRVAESPAHHQSILQYAPKSEAAADFRAIAEEFELRCAQREAEPTNQVSRDVRAASG